MGIKFRCPACDKKLHVKAFLAGKRGVCPKCGAKVHIPLADAATSTAAAVDALNQEAAVVAADGECHVPRAAASDGVRTAASRSGAARGSVGAARRSDPDPIADAPDAVWYVRPPTGGQFGPADATIMQRWLSEGRVSADALVWREGWPEWKAAGPVFPSLEGPEVPAPLGLPAAAIDDIGDTFAFAEQQPQRPAAARNNSRARPKLLGRHGALIGFLIILCIALVVALVFVLRMRN